MNDERAKLGSFVLAAACLSLSSCAAQPTEIAKTQPMAPDASMMLEIQVHQWGECLRSMAASAGRAGPRGSIQPRESCAKLEAAVRAAWEGVAAGTRKDPNPDAFVERTFSAMQPELDAIYQRNNYE